jgi:hypothetical protein
MGKARILKGNGEIEGLCNLILEDVGDWIKQLQHLLVSDVHRGLLRTPITLTQSRIGPKKAGINVLHYDVKCFSSLYLDNVYYHPIIHQNAT